MAGSSSKSSEAIVLLVPGFPVNEEETNCLPFLQDFVLSFKKQYPDKKLFVISFQYPYIQGKYLWNDVEIYSAGGKNRKYLGRLQTWLKVIFYYFKLKKKVNITGIISFWLTECTFIGQFIAILNQKKLLAYILGQDSKKSNPYLRIINLKKIQVISISEKANLALLEATGHVARGVVNMGINIQKFRQKNIENQRDIDIIGVGSLIPLKNYQAFINIISELKKENPEIRAVIIGDGLEKNKLSDLILKHNISENIELKGALSHEEVIDYLYKSKVFLHTSLAEGQAAVFSEALYCGLSVVSFDVGRIAENEKMHICQHEEEMYKKLKELLLVEQDYTPVLLRGIDDTVNDCIKLLK